MPILQAMSILYDNPEALRGYIKHQELSHLTKQDRINKKTS